MIDTYLKAKNSPDTQLEFLTLNMYLLSFLKKSDAKINNKDTNQITINCREIFKYLSETFCLDLDSVHQSVISNGAQFSYFMVSPLR